MRTSRVCVLAGAAVSAALLFVATAPSQAADLGYGSIKDIPEPVPTGPRMVPEGHHRHEEPEPGSIWTSGGGTQGAGYESGDFSVQHADIKSNTLFGLGIGIEHSRWLRFDVTGEYRGKQLFIAQDWRLRRRHSL